MDVNKLLDQLVQKYPDNDPHLKATINGLENAIANTFICPQCSSVIHSKCNYDRHVKSHSEKHTCPKCGKSYSREDSLKRHMDTVDCESKKQKQQKQKQQLEPAEVAVPQMDVQSGEGLPSPRQQSGETYRRHSTRDDSALGGAVNKHYIYPTAEDRLDLLTFCANVIPLVVQHLQERCRSLNHIKWYLNAQVVMQRMHENGEVQESKTHFRCKTVTSLDSETISEQSIDDAIQSVYKHFDEYNDRGSGWTLKEIECLEIHTAKYNPLRGKSHFNIPPSISARKATINIKNSDDRCFLWCILAALHPVDVHAEHVSNYTQFEHELNVEGLTFPMPIKQIPKFERLNNIAVTVLGYEEDDDQFFPMYARPRKDALLNVTLLYLTQHNDTHYLLVKNLNRLLKSTRADGRSYHFCKFCLQGFTSARVLDKHLQYCSKEDCQCTEFPEEGKDDFLVFNDLRKQMRVEFCIYADFEAFSIPVQTCHPNPETSGTTTDTVFEAASYGYQVVCTDDRFTKPPELYRGPNVIDHFLESLHKEELYIQQILDKTEPLRLTREETLSFHASTECYVCNRPLTNRTGKVRDHCHLSGRYRGAACSRCNLQLKSPNFIPVVFHNLKNYDMHLLIAGVGKWKDEEIKCIPCSMERYLSISLGRLRFIDSYQFLNASLQTLVQNHSENGPAPFKRLGAQFQNEDTVELLLRKGIFPYRFLDSSEKFQAPLPSRDSFYNTLTKETCSEKDYEHVVKVWNHFGMKTFSEYHDVYLRVDVLLLADVFENFRDLAMSNYSLDPLHFYSVPGLAWASSLKLTRCRLKLLTDPTMYLFLEQGVRRGVATITKRYAKANNPETEGYDPSQPTNFLFYVDCNNLYGHAMSNALPCDDFRWMDEDALSTFDVTKVPDDGNEGMVVECDLEYDESLHDLHGDFPLAPERMHVSDDMLSELSLELRDKKRPVKRKATAHSGNEKLVPTVLNKHRYIVHYRVLKLYLQLGLKITKIHKVLKFKQADFLKSYIDFNTQKRARATNEWEKSFYKLMNNAVFGKTLENVRNRCDIRLVHNAEKLERLVAKSSYKRFEIFNEDLVAVELQKVKLKLNKPVYVGQAILDLSKETMYRFHYNYIKRKFADRASLCMSDTDSFFYSIRSPNLYEELVPDHDLFDFSNYNPSHFLFSEKNRKVLGKFKDEAAGAIVSEYCGLSAKLYSYRVDRKETCKAKGIVKKTIDNDLRMEHYKRCLFEGEEKMCEMNLIQSSKHQLTIKQCTKVALSCFDDNRYLLEDNITTLPFGHRRIPKNPN